ncbi:autotransporter domain-containing protein [Candidatus Williamhamiltonella defendens]|uniref:autotransporter domain-containing protein n=1 Tax=Candidatus Williamhamiltonella defendens TaxID=138072 RepID=UPI00130E8504|nr:autotransporter domain-containing protein [Candidatus Hamiltonella defensa]
MIIGIEGCTVLAENEQASFGRWGGQSTSRNIGVSVYSRYGQSQAWYTAWRLCWASIKNKIERKISNNDEKNDRCKT